MIALCGLLAGAIGAYYHSANVQEHARQLFANNVLLAVPALAAATYFSMAGYLFAFFVFSGSGFGLAYVFANYTAAGQAVARSG